MRLGSYTLVGRLATGGMAEVLLARRHEPGGPALTVALKRILPHLSGCPEIVELFRAEARTAARLEHPNIVAVHDFAVIEGSHVLALEYVAGTDLRAVFGRGRAPLAPALVAGVAASVCAALAHAHALGIVHGDVSPSNILIGHDGTIKLCDFGVAARPGRAIVRGKRGYAAPEQRLGGDLDRRADLYALGIVACELATGRRFQPLAPFVGVAPDLADVLAAAIEADPDRRYPDATAMRSALAGIAGDTPLPDALAVELRRRSFALSPAGRSPGVDDPEERTMRMTPRPRRSRTRLLAVLGAAVVAAAAVAILS